MFKPMKAPNEVVPLDAMKFPLIVSPKLDGIRCIIKDGVLLSSHLKPINNARIVRRFAKLAIWAKNHNMILDGELLAPSLTFTELSGRVRSLNDPIPEDLTFNCFDCVIEETYNTPFKNRISDVNVLDQFPDFPKEYFVIVEQTLFSSMDEVKKLYEESLQKKCDGVMLRSPEGPYKCGRATVKEGYIYKLKPYQTFDAKIIGFVQATAVKKTAEKKINEMGNSVTSKKKDDRELVDMAAAFLVEYDGRELAVMIALTHEERKDIWMNQEKYLGRMIEYKGMLAGSKDLPRHHVFLRFRDDKEE